MALSEARTAAERVRRELRNGNDPIEAKAVSAKAVGVPTFRQAMDQYIDRATPSWKNVKSAAQWRASLETHARPLLMKSVNAITVTDMIQVLDPIWYRLPETAKRVRGRVEKILSASKTQGHRTGENPAAWRDNLANIYSPKPKLIRGHFHSMPFEDVPTFIVRLQGQGSLSALALEWIITVSRATVAVTATWGEIDLIKRLWTIPAARMKGTLEASIADEDHVVPLTVGALNILDKVASLRRTNDSGELLFPSIKDKPLSLTSLDHCRERMQVKTTTHGFRATFRTWAAQQTFHENDIAEKVLAHLVGDEVQRAYQRGNLLDKRRVLMNDWAAFISGSLTPEINPFVRQGQVSSAVLDELQRRKTG